MIVVADPPAMARENPHETFGTELAEDEGVPRLELKPALADSDPGSRGARIEMPITTLRLETDCRSLPREPGRRHGLATCNARAARPSTPTSRQDETELQAFRRARTLPRAASRQRRGLRFVRMLGAQLCGPRPNVRSARRAPNETPNESHAAGAHSAHGVG